jgi:hypothetical protein
VLHDEPHVTRLCNIYQRYELSPNPQNVGAIHESPFAGALHLIEDDGNERRRRPIYLSQCPDGFARCEFAKCSEMDAT